MGEVEIISPDEVPEGIEPLMVDSLEELYDILVANYEMWTNFSPETSEVTKEEIWDERSGAFRRIHIRDVFNLNNVGGRCCMFYTTSFFIGVHKRKPPVLE